MWTSGLDCGSSFKLPAGTITSRPLRVWWGNGDPHVMQKLVAKLRAVGRSYRLTASAPVIQRNAEASTIRLDAWAVPVAFRQREQ